MKRISGILGDWRGYPLAVALVALATWLKYLAQPDVIPSNVPILYFLAIVPTAIFFGLGPSVLVCILSLIAFDYFFLGPGVLSFFDVPNAPIFSIFLLVALVLSYLSSDLRKKNRLASQEIAARKQSEIELANYRDNLEDVVRQRTGELEKERKLLQSIMDSAGRSHLAYLDRNFNFVLVNDTYAHSCGYKPAEMVGKNHFALYPNSENEAIFARVRQTGVAEEYHDKPFEFPDQPARGVTFWDWTLMPVKNSQSVVEGLVLSMTETTERKRIENALRESEERFQEAFRSSPSALIISHFDDGLIVDVNESFERLFGYGRSQLIGRRTADLHIFVEPERANLIRLLTERGTVRGEEVVFRTGDGSLITSLVSIEPIRAGDQRLLLSTVVDITQRKLLEDKLKENEQRLRLAQDAAGAGAWEWDLKTNRNHWSDEVWKLYGLKPNSCEPSYAAWANTIEPEDRPAVERAVREAAQGGARLSTEWRVKGRGRWLMLIGQPLQDADGRAERYVGIVIDITERKQLELMKDMFIGMVSHELRTPLTVIMGALNVAADPALEGDERNSLISDAYSSAEELSAMVENLLELSRHQSNRLSLQTRQTEIAPVIYDVVARLRKRSAGHQFAVDVPSGLPPAMIDRIRIERVLHNLVENAIKYSPEGGAVKVTARRSESELIVAVSDEGIGISHEDQGRLFKSFQRLDVQDKYQIAGVGLGLRVCSVLVAAHGGRIWVESEPGEGSTFSFSLPVGGESPEQAPGQIP